MNEALKMCHQKKGKIFVVLPAAGSGERFGSEKQFQKILGRSVLNYTIETFSRMSCVEQVLVLVQPEKIEATRQSILELTSADRPIRVIAGGSSRHRTIREALFFFQQEQMLQLDATVVIHDAVRVFCTELLLKEVVRMASLHGAAGTSRPLVSTVIHANSSLTDNNARDLCFMHEALDRSRCFASEMPQAFSAPVFIQMYSQASNDDLDHGTECLMLAKKYAGILPVLIPGPEYLWKVTYSRDIDCLSAEINRRNLKQVFLINSKAKSNFLKKIAQSVFETVTVTEAIDCLCLETLQYATVMLYVENDSILEQFSDLFWQQRCRWLGMVVVVLVQERKLCHFDELKLRLKSLGSCIIFVQISTNTSDKETAEVISTAVINRNLALTGLIVTV